MIDFDSNFNFEPSAYAILLESEEWTKKRNQIVDRDDRRCLKCFNMSYFEDSSLKIGIAKAVRSEVKGDFLKISNNENRDIVRKVDSNFLKINEAYFVFTDNQFNLVSVFEFHKTQHAKVFVTELFKEGISQQSDKLKIKFIEHISQGKLKLIWKVTKFLNVHHSFYVKGRKPWEYENETLLTLCRPCHEKIHQDEIIYMYDEEGEKIKLIPCDRCGGTGALNQYHHVENGICFKCRGSRFVQNLI